MASSSKPSFNGDIDHGQLETLQTEKTFLPSPQAQAAKDVISSIVRRLDSKAQGQTGSTQNWRHRAHNEGRIRGFGGEGGEGGILDGKDLRGGHDSGEGGWRLIKTSHSL